MADFIWAKSALEIDEQDTRHILWNLLKRVQVLELHLAEAVALLLFTTATDTGPDLSEEQYLLFVNQLTEYLSQTGEQMKHMQEIEARYRAEQN